MEDRKIYEDIALRTEGDIYIGVVGPVRTGKSTFIKRFMETLVIPNIENVYRRERARDELPQSGSGRTIMTAEPKFVPEEAVAVTMEGGAAFQVRLIDCVGYMVEGAVGHLEGETQRMVTTPWFDHEIPMSEAAEIGTRKVIAEHSTIGIVITTDGTITEIPREDYLDSAGTLPVDYAHEEALAVTGQDPRAAVEAALPPDTARDLYRITLTGETGEAGVDAVGLAQALEPRFYALEVRDATRMAEDIWARAGEDSLRGLFLRQLRTRWDSAATEEERETVTQAARFGLAALDHRDLG